MSLTVLSVAYPLAPVSPDAVGGAEQVLSALDGALVAHGHRSLVIAMEGSCVAGELLAVPAETGPLDETARRRAHARHREAIAKALDRYPIDVVHLHGIDFYAYQPDRAPTLVTLHLPLDWYPSEALHPNRPDLWLHAVSKSQQATAPAGTVLTDPIPNGVDVDALSQRHARRGFALLLSRICPEKGIHLAIDAAKAVDMPLLIGGEVYRYADHERYFETEVAPRLDARRRFLGPLGLTRKRRFLNAARCLVIPSLARETSSLVAMEALACGTPVVAFPNGALSEVIEHGRTGFLVTSVEEMAEAMRHAGDLSPIACQRAVRERFSLTVMVEGYFRAYEALAAMGEAHASAARSELLLQRQELERS
jgi:glycosyltransferase involved in cell wall biosynthesis